MSTIIEDLGNNQAKLTFTADAATLEEALKFSYNKNKNRVQIQGFRKGKAPRKLIEAQYGKQIFYDDAINHILPDAYRKAAEESDLDIVSRPEIDVENLDEKTGVTFIATVFLKPVAAVHDYRGLTYKKTDTSVSEEEIMDELNKDREKNAREITVTDRPIKEGDIATINYKGYKDDVPFEGGEAKDYELKIGSKTFIDTFEDQLIGHSVGDDVDVRVTFPEEYHAPNLAGQPVRFDVEITDIKEIELPELDDDFAADISEFETLEEYKASLRDKLETAKKDNEKVETENQVAEALLEKTEVTVPQAMIESQIDSMVQSFANQIKSHGLSLDVYLQYAGQTMESLREMYAEQASTQVRVRLALEAVAKAEGMSISDEEVDAELTRMSEEYEMPKERLASVMDKGEKKGLRIDLLVQKAMMLLLEEAVCIE